MLRNTLSQLAQQISERLIATPSEPMLPDIARSVGKCLSSGCYVASSGFMLLAVLFSPGTKAQTDNSLEKPV